jgi:predicted acetyltransferase
MPAPQVRVIRPEEFEAFDRLDDVAFGQRPDPAMPLDAATWELDRAYGAFEDGSLVGNGRLYSFELTMPGGAIVPAAAVSWIAVSPTRRRRGVLGHIMAALHADARRRGEPLAILSASEGGIYGRFGYGVATWRLGATIDRAGAELGDDGVDPGSIELLDIDDAQKLLAPAFDVIRRQRAGMVGRPDAWWPTIYHFLSRDEAAFLAAHRDAAGDIDGFALYTLDARWDRGIPDKTLSVRDLQSADGTARRALWRYLLGVDLVARVRADFLPVDEPLRFQLRDPRRFRIDYVNDQLWVRLLDPVRVLGARSYAPGAQDVVVEAHDPTGPVFRLSIGPDGVGRSRKRPELVMGIAELGAICLGGTRCTQLAAGGRVEERVPGAAARADVLFATAPAPATLTGF